MTNLKQYKVSKSEELKNLLGESTLKKDENWATVDAEEILYWLQTYTEELEAKVREDERERIIKAIESRLPDHFDDSDPTDPPTLAVNQWGRALLQTLTNNHD